MALQPYPVILASTSPRRRALLRWMGVRFRVASPSVDEKRLTGEAPRIMVRRLARDKARACFKKDAVVIAADTVVVAPGGRLVLGKPKNAQDAVRMLMLLQGKTHTVWTGFCVLHNQTSCVRAVATRVTFREMTRSDCTKYVSSGEPMDKAGAYAAQGMGMTLIKRISGSYTNVVGLPMCEVWECLQNVTKR